MAGSSEMILSARHLAKVGVEGSNPFARSKICQDYIRLRLADETVSVHVISGKQRGSNCGNREAPRLKLVLKKL